MKHLGGRVNFPIYENVSRIVDVCPKLTTLNTELNNKIDEIIRLNKQIKLNNNNNTNKIQKPQLSTEVINYIKLKKAIDTQRDQTKLEKLLEEKKKYTEDEISQYIQKYQEYIEYMDHEKKIKNLKKTNSSNNSSNDLNIDLKSTLTLHDFQNILNTNCNNLYKNEGSHIILIDKNYNHVHANYTDLLSNETDVHVFKITSIYQVNI